MGAAASGESGGVSRRVGGGVLAASGVHGGAINAIVLEPVARLLRKEPCFPTDALAMPDRRTAPCSPWSGLKVRWLHSGVRCSYDPTDAGAAPTVEKRAMVCSWSRKTRPTPIAQPISPFPDTTPLVTARQSRVGKPLRLGSSPIDTAQVAAHPQLIALQRRTVRGSRGASQIRRSCKRLFAPHGTQRPVSAKRWRCKWTACRGGSHPILGSRCVQPPDVALQAGRSGLRSGPIVVILVADEPVDWEQARRETRGEDASRFEAETAGPLETRGRADEKALTSQISVAVLSITADEESYGSGAVGLGTLVGGSQVHWRKTAGHQGPVRSEIRTTHRCANDRLSHGHDPGIGPLKRPFGTCKHAAGPNFGAGRLSCHVQAHCD